MGDPATWSAVIAGISAAGSGAEMIETRKTQASMKRRSRKDQAKTTQEAQAAAQIESKKRALVGKRQTRDRELLFQAGSQQGLLTTPLGITNAVSGKSTLGT